MKKILYLCHRIPYPPNKGDKIRSFNEIKYLSKRYTIDLITLADDPDDLKYVTELKKICRRVRIFQLKPGIAKIKGVFSLLSGRSISEGYFYKKGFQTVFDRWTASEHYDAVICFSSPMAEYIFRSRKSPEPIPLNLIMDFCDLDSDKWLQYSKTTVFPANLIFRTEASRLLKFEKKVNQAFDRSIFVSHKEAELFHDYFPGAENINVIPNGVDHEFFNPAQTETTKVFPCPMIMFSGAMDYYANIDGVTWFAENILPEIKKKIPEIVFYIVGSHPAPAVKALEKDPSIRVTGFVDDIREYYKAADLCVIPLRIARGVQNKVLEAMSMKKAVVVTSQAVQGISIEDHRVAEIEDEPDKFVRKVIQLLGDKESCRSLGQNARNFVLDHYDWDVCLKKIY